MAQSFFRPDKIGHEFHPVVEVTQHQGNIVPDLVHGSMIHFLDIL
jgi:hypothetical protein